MKNKNVSPNVLWHHGEVSREAKEKRLKHKGAALWFTGLSGSGKSTLSHAVEQKLFEINVHTTVLDGDNVRHGLCGDLGFSDVARRENIRRVGEVSKLFVDTGMIVLTAFISPFREDRQVVRKLHKNGDFIEVYCAASLEQCEDRDVKGLYARARQGEIKDFTGISSPYEKPEHAELTVATGSQDIEESVDQVITYLKQQNIIKS